MSVNPKVNFHPQHSQMQQYRILPHPPASPRSVGMTSATATTSPLAPRLYSARPGLRPQGIPVGMGSYSAPPSRLARPEASDDTPPTGRKTTGAANNRSGSKLTPTSAPPTRALPNRPIAVLTPNPTLWIETRPVGPRRPHTSDSYKYQSRRQHDQVSAQLSALSLSKLDVCAFNEGAEITGVCFTCESSNSHTGRFQCDDTERPQDRFAYFKTEKNVRTTKKRVSLGIPIPPNFPIGKYHTHLAMTKKNGKDIITHFHHKAIVVLFNPWDPCA